MITLTIGHKLCTMLKVLNEKMYIATVLANNVLN